MIAYEYGVSFHGDENISQLEMMAAHDRECTKSH